MNERSAAPSISSTATQAGTAGEVFRAFLKLGLTAFGGPVAHLGYFRAEFVERRRWLDEAHYAELVALCQLLPGPASSQTGFLLGLHRAGMSGALAAWTAFTLPSALLMAGFALGAGSLAASPLGAGLLQGLKLVAVAVVAQAVWSMARSLCPDLARRIIAVAAALLATTILAGTAGGQVLVIVLGALAGLLLRRAGPDDAEPHWAGLVSRRFAGVALFLFAVLLTLALLWPNENGGLGIFAAFARAGVLVFGGGHVVLPLLESAVVAPGWITDSAFIAGYGAAQAMPGPLFTFAAYLGLMLAPGLWGWVYGGLALVAIFLPGLLLVSGVVPFWVRLKARPAARSAFQGINAAVVGLLAAALIDPVWPSAVHDGLDILFAVLGFALLIAGRLSPLSLVLTAAVYGVCRALIG